MVRRVDYDDIKKRLERALSLNRKLREKLNSKFSDEHKKKIVEGNVMRFMKTADGRNTKEIVLYEYW